MLHSEHKLIMMFYDAWDCMRIVHVLGAVHIRAVATYMHALARGTSCTDMKRRVYETLQCPQVFQLLLWRSPSPSR